MTTQQTGKPTSKASTAPAMDGYQTLTLPPELTNKLLKFFETMQTSQPALTDEALKAIDLYKRIDAELLTFKPVLDGKLPDSIKQLLQPLGERLSK